METKTFSLIHYLRKAQLDKTGKAGIYLRITVNGQRTELSIKRKTTPEKWCSVKGSQRNEPLYGPAGIQSL